jgi:hypothetical protein
LIQQYKSLKNSSFFDPKSTKGPTIPVDEIDRARRRRGAIYLRRPRKRRLKPACLSEKDVARLFQHRLITPPDKKVIEILCSQG